MLYHVECTQSIDVTWQYFCLFSCSRWIYRTRVADKYTIHHCNKTTKLL